jgi:hypothetical protein
MFGNDSEQDKIVSCFLNNLLFAFKLDISPLSNSAMEVYTLVFCNFLIFAVSATFLGKMENISFAIIINSSLPATGVTANGRR